MSSKASSASPRSAAPAPLKAERIQLTMEQIPGWSLSHDGRQAWRQFQFRSRRQTVAFLRQAIQAAESAQVAIGSRGPVVSYRGDSVTVAIWAYKGGFTAEDLALARRVGQLS